MAMRSRPALLTGLAYAAFISLGLPDGLTGVAWPSLRATFDLPLDALGALVTSSTVGYLLSSFSSGRVLARLGVGWLLTLSCLATALSLLGYSAAPQWMVMVGLSLLAGLGAGAIDAGLNTYAAEHFDPRTVNWLHASYGLGAASGPLIMSSVINAGASWRLGYLIVGASQALLAACFAWTRRRWHTDSSPEGAGPRAGASMLNTLALPIAWLSMLLFFLYSGLEFAAGQWVYTLLTAARGIDAVAASIWVSVYWGSLTVGRVLSGMIVARISVERLLRLCMGGALLGTLLLWLNLTPWLALSGLALLGLSLAPMFPSLIALTPARMGPLHTANTVGFQITAAMLGGAALVSGFGLIAERFGLEALGPFLLVVALLLTGTFALLERAPRRTTPG
ncbi:MFS transporter [Kallotenue papyrolyticum]|uniref:MFS transporter n=1 Tax=Kallotenue papyrolyticum TaxID=1325125 RepID=UPI0006942E22|nr:MFS transporter [Kallotenue papyrolyticum]